MNISRHEQLRDQLDQARAAAAGDQFDLALQCIERALALDPSSPEARLAEARLHLQRNSATLALKALDALDQYQPEHRDTPEVAFLRARALLRAGQDDLALRTIEQLVQRFPDDVRAHRMMVGLCLKRGRFEKAQAHQRRVLELEPSQRSGRRNLAKWTSVVDPEAAAALLAEGVPNRRRSPAPQKGAMDAVNTLRRARLLAEAGRHREADELYAQLLPSAQGDVTVWREAGELADAMGADALALERLKHALKASRGRDAQTLIAMARLHMHAGRFGPAARCWRKLARRGGKDLHAWTGLLVCALLSRRPRLVNRATAAIQTHTDAGQCRRVLGEQWLHAVSGVETSHALASEWEERTDDHSPLEALLHEAAQHLQAHAQRHPQRADTHYHLAVCRRALGDDEQAVLDNASALLINPRYAAARRLQEQIVRRAAA